MCGRDRSAREKLRKLGVHQRWSTRYGTYVILLLVLVVAISCVVFDLFHLTQVQFHEFAGPLTVVGGLLVGLNQWRHLRNETTIAGSLERLDIVNQYFRNPEHQQVVQYFFEGSTTPTWEQGIDDPRVWQRQIYVFMELDNLQYGIEKYRLGYSSPYECLLTVDLSAARCQSPRFFAVAKVLAQENAGSYTSETRNVVTTMEVGTRFL